MVCPNCHSEQIIAVQDQHFCISCGQMVPDEVVAKAKAAEPKTPAKVQANGLPEGVKILPIGTAPIPVAPDEKPADAPVPGPKAKVAAVKPDSAEPKPAITKAEAAKPAEEPKPEPESGLPTIIKHRSRMQLSTEPGNAASPSPEIEPPAEQPKPQPEVAATAAPATTAPAAMGPAKRRKPGRPKAGRLDIPRAIASTAPAGLPAAPAIAPGPPPPPPASGPRRMSDIAPRRPAGRPAPHQEPAHAPAAPKAQITAKPETAKADAALPAEPAPAREHPRHRAHKVGVPPLHYAPIVAFSLRMRLHPKLLGLGVLGSIALGAASAYGAWMVLTRGVEGLAEDIMAHPPKLIAGTILLAIMYYIGRSLGQTAIIYGIAREADQRPVALNRQFGVAVNTFWRRLGLDSLYGLGELALIAGAAIVFLTGGDVWPMNSNLQLGLIFTVYLVILYLLTALALSKGLAGVSLTLSSLKTGGAAKLGWRLFSHRIELIGPRFGAVLLEAALAIPLVALAVWLVIAAPPQYHLAVTIGAGLLATLAGALTGVGTAAWWSMLYRQLVLADRPAEVSTLLSTRQPEEARRGSLAAIVAISTLVIAAILILPWLQLV
jgi:hypothetical protein